MAWWIEEEALLAPRLAEQQQQGCTTEGERRQGAAKANPAGRACTRTGEEEAGGLTGVC